ncbi:hypothetical protein TorRG33x02_346900 [Trema orientale]|uniref:Uncharacterized protein n=1 Tax=Trema orientale TaxID=63057 RepID=A0A2P5AMM7_TREOI|nr:hypothetical protein TorRG33x02_346900 [Trema orientale]
MHHSRTPRQQQPECPLGLAAQRPIISKGLLRSDICCVYMGLKRTICLWAWNSVTSLKNFTKRLILASLLRFLIRFTGYTLTDQIEGYYVSWV